MDYKNIQELIKTMSDSKLSSLEIEAEGISIRMRKGEETPGVVVCREKEMIEKPQQVVNKVVEEISLESSVIEKAEEELLKTAVNDNTVTVNSPIVGTFYSAASPDAEPYVKKGSKVKKGDALCIVEAMKLMNEIEAEYDCEIVEVLVNNEEMIEYGQPMFKVVKL
ncbi:acetyl-CoA carboxylase biotin carboxyl carrier protein [Clostridium sp. ZS2-4]|uniref:acetyl-CoA carboxylase biotin carboxyl carrier protein n=1 Tax=Clostridium sp. ZS2-4 TaxID=2987703 RepID=UPI00227BB404|nr:acetyl-CoA carboxylase biotin carboxyl carrier protein [Clostridium sp. ZS2-4]MCY6353704.1 acetyl-CoA carboxylase biotin carboxyl carrier protein [Clostridium sp. ZS2-4]